MTSWLLTTCPESLQKTDFHLVITPFVLNTAQLARSLVKEPSLENDGSIPR
jgi:hypothetical protein